MKRSILFISILFVFCFSANCEDSQTLFPTRTEVKLGVPNLLGLAFEYILPVSVFEGTTLGIDFDFSCFSFSILQYAFYHGTFIKLYFTGYGDGLYFKTGYSISLTKSQGSESRTIQFFWDVPVCAGWRWMIGNFSLQLGLGVSFRSYAHYGINQGGPYYENWDTYTETISEGLMGILQSISFEFSFGGAF